MDLFVTQTAISGQQNIDSLPSEDYDLEMFNVHLHYLEGIRTLSHLF